MDANPWHHPWPISLLLPYSIRDLSTLQLPLTFVHIKGGPLIFPRNVCRLVSSSLWKFLYLWRTFFNLWFYLKDSRSYVVWIRTEYFSFFFLVWDYVLLNFLLIFILTKLLLVGIDVSGPVNPPSLYTYILHDNVLWRKRFFNQQNNSYSKLKSTCIT